MTAEQIVPNVYRLPLGEVNAYLLEHDGGLTLLDTGHPGNEEKILAGVRSVGKRPEDIRHIVVTHCHPDHTGSLAALKRATGAPTYMHPADAALVREGTAARSMRPGPGIKNSLIFYLVLAPRFLLSARKGRPLIEGAEIDHEIQEGETLHAAGGLQPIHVPGHCAGQLAFLWNQEGGGVLFGADAARDAFDMPAIFEDVDEGRHSLQKLAAFDFDTACFGHGEPIRSGAAELARRKWGGAPGM